MYSPGTVSRISARVRWPYILTSSDVMIVTEEGASAMVCGNLDAASTTSILIRSGKLISVGSAGLAAMLTFSAAQFMAGISNNIRQKQAPLVIEGRSKTPFM